MLTSPRALLWIDRTPDSTPEQAARDLLERMDVEGAQSMTGGDVVELANLISDYRQLVRTTSGA